MRLLVSDNGCLNLLFCSGRENEFCFDSTYIHTYIQVEILNDVTTLVAT